VAGDRTIHQRIEQLSQQAEQLAGQGRFPEAIDLAIQVRDLALRHLGRRHQVFVQSLTRLAGLYHSAGDYASAEPLYRQAMEGFP
jgi:hypothetical protein